VAQRHGKPPLLSQPAYPNVNVYRSQRIVGLPCPKGGGDDCKPGVFILERLPQSTVSLWGNPWTIRAWGEVATLQQTRIDSKSMKNKESHQYHPPEAPSVPSVGRQLAVAGLLVVLANLPFWILASRYFLTRPIFNSDAALALLGATTGPLGLLLGLLMAWSLDAVQSLSLSYHFHSPADFAAAAKYIQHLHVGDFLSLPMFAVASLFAATALAVVLFARRHRLRVWALVTVTSALVALDVANGSGLPTLLGSDRVRLSLNVQGSPLLNLVSASLHAREQASTPLADLPASGTPMPEVVDWARRHPDGSVLIVLVESWGWHVDPALRAWTARALTLAGDGQNPALRCQPDVGRVSGLDDGRRVAHAVRLVGSLLPPARRTGRQVPSQPAGSDGLRQRRPARIQQPDVRAPSLVADFRAKPNDLHRRHGR